MGLNGVGLSPTTSFHEDLPLGTGNLPPNPESDTRNQASCAPAQKAPTEHRPTRPGPSFLRAQAGRAHGLGVMHSGCRPASLGLTQGQSPSPRLRLSLHPRHSAPF